MWEWNSKKSIKHLKGNTGSLEKKNWSRWSLQHESKTFILFQIKQLRHCRTKAWQSIHREERQTHIVNSNFDWNNVAGLVSCLGIVILTEGHNINTLRTKSRAYRRSWGSLSSLQSKLYHPNYCKPEKQIRWNRSQIKDDGWRKLRVYQKKKFTLLGFSTGLGFRRGHWDNTETPWSGRDEGGRLAITEEPKREIEIWRQPRRGWSEKWRGKMLGISSNFGRKWRRKKMMLMIGGEGRRHR